MKWNHPQFAPYDIRLTIRIISGLLVWKTLSADFTNLIVLARDPKPIFWVSMHLDSITQWLSSFGARIFVSPLYVQSIQIAVAVALTAAAIWLNRWAMLVAWCLMWLFWSYVLLYTANVFESEVYLFFLLLFIGWPGSWRTIANSSRTVSPAATAVGCTCIFTIGVWYFYAGWAKVRIDPTWVLHARLEHLYPAVRLWRGDDPGWLGTSLWFNEIWTLYPWVGTASAAIVLVAELLFPLALVSKWARRFVVLSMLAFHICFFLSGGSFFLPNILVLIIFSMPWRKIGRSDARPESAITEIEVSKWTTRERIRMAFMMLLTLGLHTACVVKNQNYVPVMNWCVFSWSYPTFDAPIETFRIGYRDTEDGEILPMPHNCGGFLGYRYTHSLSQFARQLSKETDPAIRATTLAKLNNLLDARRPHGSNSWLLGPLTLPDHALIRSRPPQTGENTEYFIMVGESTYQDRHFHTEWKKIEPLQR